MEFLLNLLIVILVSAATGVIFNFVVERKLFTKVVMGYIGAVIFGVLGGILGFYYLTPVVNFLALGTNINFISIILGALIVVWVGLKVNELLEKR